ncbi:bifunctional glycosyltransferase 87/phosphatase PAP2 family protein [Streptomyces montanisoli]|uniref:bifunctional glycosyltransferase 87/phosphatase PAP2 family protein n=1 Tax=Streptomyces montanisoli TaxID=2798581 RepID=UPI0027DAFA22|nr:bifunctional glycosyltransferase 87/phosphatase PAP2 family protein [Streptomyces montanisoli]
MSGGPAAARALLWLVAAVLAARQVAAVLGKPPGSRLTDLATWMGPTGVLHVRGSLYDHGSTFTGTPFAGAVLKPLTRSAEQSLGVAWTFGTLLLVVAVGVVAARALPGRTRVPAAPVAISLLMLSLPVRNSFHLGQTSIIPVLLVLLGCFAARGERGAGLLVGLGAALQPAVLLFAPLLWLTGRRKAAVTSVATFIGCSALAWAVLPADSRTYWVHHLAGIGLGESASGLANQSLHGALLRFGAHGVLGTVLAAVLAAVVVWIGLRRAVRYAKDGQLLLAVAVTGCVAVAVSPTAWQYQLMWILLALAGRVGRRAKDRLVWPVVVVLVMTLPGTVLLPNMAFVAPVRDNVPLLAALAAACVVPFLGRTSPYFDRPVPTDYAQPVPARLSRVPLAAPVWRRLRGRPNLVLELLVIRVGYSAYSHIRLAASADPATAEAHGRAVHALERFLHIDVEHWANHALVHVGWLRAFLDFYYETFHFAFPLAILAVLYWRSPADYRWARSSLSFATVLALVGFWFFPLAPPRLMPGLGFIDTVHGPQDLAHPSYGAMTAVTNQYAAMPSLHFGWSLWCGVTVVVLAPKVWMKLLALLDPLFTVSAIIATANHWVLDAVGGATVVAAGFGLMYLLGGPRRLLPAAAPASASGDLAPNLDPPPSSRAIAARPVEAPDDGPPPRDAGRAPEPANDPGRQPGPDPDPDPAAR